MDDTVSSSKACTCVLFTKPVYSKVLFDWSERESTSEPCPFADSHPCKGCIIVRRPGNNSLRELGILELDNWFFRLISSELVTPTNLPSANVGKDQPTCCFVGTSPYLRHYPRLPYAILPSEQGKSTNVHRFEKVYDAKDQKCEATA